MKWWVTFGFLLWLSAGFLGVPGPVSKLTLLVLAIMTLFGSRMQGLLGGFLVGLVEGAVIGSNIAAFAASRMIVGYILGSLRSLDFDANFIVAAVWAFLTSITAQILFRIGVPGGSFVEVALATLGAALLNAALAIPLYWLASKVFASNN